MTKSKGPRVLTCQKTGRKFEYAGVGRPPKYHPDVRESVRKDQRKQSRKNRAAEKSMKLAA